MQTDHVVRDLALLWSRRQVVVKSQILAGGRGLGHFTNGLKGGVHIVKAADAPALAEKMLGGTLVGSRALLQAPARLLLRLLSLGEELRACRTDCVARMAACYGTSYLASAVWGCCCRVIVWRLAQRNSQSWHL